MERWVETIAALIAGRAVHVEVHDREMREELLPRLEGFVVAPVADPWLVVEARRLERDAAGVGRLHAAPLPGGGFALRSDTIEGEVLPGAPRRARVAASPDKGLAMFLQAAVAMLLPDDGALMVHADVVEAGGRAIAVVGPSGAGKSTTARGLADGAGLPLFAVDRVWLEMNGRGPVAGSLPRLVREHQVRPARSRLPLGAVLFPGRAERPVLRDVAAHSALARLLGAVLLVEGAGLPVGAAAEVAGRVLGSVRAAELAFALGDDLGPAVAELGADSWES